MRLVINGYDIELTEKQTISRTLQVNDIISLSNRQTNYTNTFTVERTPNNIKAFEMLGVLNVISTVPYEKNECYLYTDDGECLVYKGWAVIQSTDKAYKVNIYDGNIDLYKAIENKNLGDLNLSEIDHQKTLATVVNSFTANLNYKYIIADYNGLTIYNTNRINIDYLVPSAKVSYLWNKIFTTYGFTFEGSVFNTQDFTNLWLSYPKFAELDVTPVVIFNGYSINYTGPGATYTGAFDQSITVDTINDIDKIEFISPSYSTYRITLNNSINSFYQITDWTGMPTGSETFNYVILYVNGVYIADSNQPFIDITLNENDVITIGVPEPFVNNGYSATGSCTGQCQLIISEFQGVPISFSNELKDFSVKDFISEVLNRFGLTPFKSKYENHYKFLTLNELLQSNQVVDWSREANKFVSFESESYIFGSYAQENKFTYKYNDQEDDYYNSEILISNVNLPDNKVVVGSRCYAPEKQSKVLVHDLVTNVYKMWEKEVQDNGSIKYKGLSKRYYLMRESSHTFTSATDIGSSSLNSHQSITTVPVESFYGLQMIDVVSNYYESIGNILNNSKLIKASIFLTEKEITYIDFSKLYWIKELGNYFLLNKINNFVKKGITKVELIKVDKSIVGGPEVIPRIDLGRGKRFGTFAVNDPIKIYQNTIYGTDMFIAGVVGVTSYTEIDINNITATISTAGTYEVFLIVESNTERGISLTSNKIILTII